MTRDQLFKEIQSHMRRFEDVWYFIRHGLRRRFEPKSMPLSFWTAQDILKYIKITGIPYCSLYGDIIEKEEGKLVFSGYQRTGCAGCLYGCHLRS
ncbi:MAG: phosphoadenosine phosphosulfate reductase family protein [Clostridia bacterium]|nr:phosphoadenosine phosphosulfate reductase family protein [Clostridia bacterium]